jgi:hypothetical protein
MRSDPPARLSERRSVVVSDGQSSADLVCDHLGLVVFTIARPVDDRHPATPGDHRERVEGLCPSRVGKLRTIACLKLGPARGIVPEPLPETGTWAEVPCPRIESQFGLCPASRPYPVDKHSMTIVGLWFVVRPLQPDVRRRRQRTGPGMKVSSWLPYPTRFSFAPVKSHAGIQRKLGSPQT